MKLGLIFFASLTMLASYAAVLQWSQNQEQQKKLESVLTQVSELGARNQALEQQVASLKTPAAAVPDVPPPPAVAPSASGQNPELARLRSEMSEAKAVLAQLNQKWAALGISARKESLAQDRQRLGALQEQLGEENEFAKSQNAVTRDALGGAAQEQRAQIAQLTEQMSETNDLHKGLVAQIANLKSQRSPNKPQIASLQVQDSAARQSIEVMKAQRSSLTAALAASKARLADAKAVVPPANAADLREQIGVLRGRIQEKEALGRASDQATQALAAEIDAQKRKIGALEDSIRATQ